MGSRSLVKAARPQQFNLVALNTRPGSPLQQPRLRDAEQPAKCFLQLLEAHETNTGTQRSPPEPPVQSNDHVRPVDTPKRRQSSQERASRGAIGYLIAGCKIKRSTEFRLVAEVPTLSKR